MSTKYDGENLLADILKILTTNLNTSIAAVEAEKLSQGLPETDLLPVDTTSGYFLQSWSPANLNISPAIFYGIEDLQSTGIGPTTAQVYKVFIELIFTDNGLDAFGVQRVMRYSRAIKDVMEQNWDKLPVSSGKINIETVRPVSFKLEENSSEQVRIGGVSIVLQIA